MLSGDILIGSELFLNDHDTPEQIKVWVRQMMESQLQVIRLFVIWEQVEPKENCWNFTQYDAVFSEAEICGMKVVPTFMSVNPPKWMKKYGLYDFQGDLDNPTYHRYSSRYIKAVTRRYFQSPALHSWILWNEPTRKIKTEPFALLEFQNYLWKKYGEDPEKVSEMLEELSQQQEDTSAGDVCAGRSLRFSHEWASFSVWNMKKQLQTIKKTIKTIDSIHPVHVNPHMTGYNHMMEGQSPWMEGEIVDFMGCSVHPVWHSTRFPRDRIHQSVAFFCDLIKSCTKAPNQYYWVTEMQGGPTIISGRYPSCPRQKDIKRWMWEAIGAGSKGIVFWCFNTRDEGLEAGEWGLLNQMGQPSKRLQQVAEISKTLQTHKEMFSSAIPQRPDVYLFYSETAMKVAWALGDAGWSPVQGDDIEDPRNKNMVLDALAGCYLLCSDLGLNVQFVDEKKIQEHELETQIPLIIPNVFASSHGVWKAVARYLKKGGFVITDGMTGFKNADGSVNRKMKPQLDAIFGAVEEIEGYPNEFVLGRYEKEECKGWHIKCILHPEKNSQVILQDAEHSPVVMITCWGEGHCLRIGTSFFQRYLSHPSDTQRDLFKAWSGLTCFSKIRLENNSPFLRLRSLQIPEGEAIILMNWGPCAKAVLQDAADGDLWNIEGEYIDSTAPGKKREFLMKENEVKVFKWKRLENREVEERI